MYYSTSSAIKSLKASAPSGATQCLPSCASIWRAGPSPLSLSLVLTHELRTTTGSPPPPPSPSLCFPSVRPLCAFTLLRRRALSCRHYQLQSHIDVPPGDTSTHRSRRIVQRFCIDWQREHRKGRAIPIPIPIWREYERHKYRSSRLETFATEQQPDPRTTR